jgi:hypothetical protein
MHGNLVHVGEMAAPAISKAARRLKKLREAASPKITVREMADELSLPHTSYAYYEDSYKKELLPVEVTRRIAAVLSSRGVDVDAVLALAGIGGFKSQAAVFTADTVEVGDQSFTPVGRFDASFSMGPGSLIPDMPEPLGYWMLETQWLRTLSKAPQVELAIVRCSNDSMQPTFFDGDWVLIDKTQKRLSREGLYAIRVGDDSWIKRISLNIRTKKIRVLSDNPTTPAQPDVDEEDLCVIGRVVALVARKVP